MRCLGLATTFGSVAGALRGWGRFSLFFHVFSVRLGLAPSAMFEISSTADGGRECIVRPLEFIRALWAPPRGGVGVRH